MPPNTRRAPSPIYSSRSGKKNTRYRRNRKLRRSPQNGSSCECKVFFAVLRRERSLDIPSPPPPFEKGRGFYGGDSGAFRKRQLLRMQGFFAVLRRERSLDIPSPSPKVTGRECAWEEFCRSGFFRRSSFGVPPFISAYPSPCPSLGEGMRRTPCPASDPSPRYAGRFLVCHPEEGQRPDVRVSFPLSRQAAGAAPEIDSGK